MVTSYEIVKQALASFMKFIWNEHLCKILFIIGVLT